MDKAFSKLSVFDVDHTLLSCNSSFRFGVYLYKRSVLPFSSMLYLAFCYARHKLLGLSIFDLHSRIFEAFFKGRSLVHLQQEVGSFLSESLETMLFSPAVARLQKAQSEGHYTFLLSSGPDFLIGPLARHLGVNGFVSTCYQPDATQHLASISDLVDGPRKAEAFTELLKKLSLSKEDTFVYSDSELDLPLFQLAGKPIAVSPTPALRKLCKQNGWEIVT